MTGTVNISRDLFNHSAFKAAPFSEREAWLWIIMEASWRPRQKRIGHIVVDVGRAQLAASVRFMAEAWGWTPAKVQRFLERLKKLEMIRAETDTGLTLLTVCNYNKFQAKERGTDTGPIQDRYRTDTKEKKEERREEGLEGREAIASPKAATGSRLSEAWFLPQDWGEWALTEGMGRDAIRIEADKFRDYWISVPGAKGRKAHWLATWRNWIRKAAKDGQRNGHGNGHATDRQKFGAAINRLADDLTSGAASLDYSSRDPFAARPRGHA